ncbi:MAG: flagellin lysine-N-methylase [Lachnospiraceae bacterium]|nr:flagellin lysine-N-methylase [Lachnospiraceae bacterium]
MLLRVPDYYKNFKCIADKCKDSCCIGWEIDIDEDTFAYYNCVEGPFGERLRANMAEGEENTFVLKENGRCPFLNDKNLCDICVELGEEALSHVCTEYPRFVTEFGDTCEKSLALSCEVVGQLVFESSRPFAYEEIRQEDYFEEVVPQEDFADAEAADDVADADDAEDDCDLEDADPVMISMMEQARDRVIAILQNRKLCVEERLKTALCFGWAVQEKIVAEDWDGMKHVFAEFEADKMGDGMRMQNRAVTGKEAAHTGNAALDDFRARIRIFEGMEVLDEEWQAARDHVKEVISGMTAENYRTALRQFLKFYQAEGREYEYEHLCVYFLFRYCMQSVYDYNFYNHVATAAASFLMIRDMDLVRYLDHGGQFTLEDRIDIARIYSKEVEHSEENLEYLCEAFCYEAVFQRESLLRQI